MPRIKQIKQGPVTVLTVEASLLGDVTEALREKVAACLDAGEVQLILDFQPVTYVDSAALSMLLSHSRQARQKGGAIKIAHVTGVCHDIFVATRLGQVLEIYPDIHSALRSFL
jgi:anti-anti-sigma factor